MRGINIDIPATLKKYYKNKIKNNTREEFENYLEEIGLEEKFNKMLGKIEIDKIGYIASIDYDNPNYPSKAYLINGALQYQYWYVTKLDQKGLKQKKDFSNKKYYNAKIEKKLKSLWEDKFVLVGKMELVEIQSEWVYFFFPSKNFFSKNMKGGFDIDSDIDYLYEKYKQKYKDQKQLLIL